MFVPFAGGEARDEERKTLDDKSGEVLSDAPNADMASWQKRAGRKKNWGS